MVSVLYGALILAGFVLGYFFQAPVLAIFTSACVIVGIYMAMTLREMATLMTLVFIACAIVANTVMWITYYLVTNQSWLQIFFKTYILR